MIHPRTGTRMPALFLGHGNPMHAIEPNRFADAWRAIASRLPLPNAILVVSAHWYTRGTFVCSSAQPRTIHDFGGFPQALFDVRYPAPGAPALATRIISELGEAHVSGVEDWGLDHGAWSLLVHMYPDADVPVLQLSIDATRPPAWHYELGRRLAALREESVLILGSGNVVHNLGRIDWSATGTPHPWAARFEQRIREALEQHDHRAIIGWLDTPDDDTRLSVPTPEHFLPLLYVAGTRHDAEPVSFPVDGIDMGSIGMLGVRFG